MTVFLLLSTFAGYGASKLFELYSNSSMQAATVTIDAIVVPSKMDCVAQCDRIPICNSFSYNDKTSKCVLSDATKITVPSVALDNPDYSLYTKGMVQLFSCSLSSIVNNWDFSEYARVRSSNQPVLKQCAYRALRKETTMGKIWS